ncbi:hypothetical protein NLJ89_g5008 [Agrocybe chaxingu]|uniref:Uncharacterized protein n=1 Tax=Agrocybe chaxingu TaxID=84603 RepID=A0A9W8K328_9AGAR|nr:hypothetical protein NLJ89_g5008 [Agrocybe chaxingu]
MDAITLPLDIFPSILDELANDKDGGLESLKSCSLVSRALAPLSQSRFFNTISLNEDDAPHTPQRLEHLLRASPAIANYIREVDFFITRKDIYSPTAPSVLEMLTKITAITIGYITDGGRPLDWQRPSFLKLRQSLVNSFHLPTLRALTLESGIKNLPVTDLLGCSNLKRLEIYAIAVVNGTSGVQSPVGHLPIQLSSFNIYKSPRDTVKTIIEAAMQNGTPVFDVTRLTTISFCTESENYDAMKNLIMGSQHLTHLNLTILADYRFDCKELANMVASSRHTLKFLQLELRSEGRFKTPPLLNLCPELEKIANQGNVIESITITTWISAYIGPQTWNDWDDIRKALLREGWPCLGRISLVVQLIMITGIEDEAQAGVKERLERLHETHLSALVSHSEFTFTFSFEAVDESELMAA